MASNLKGVQVGDELLRAKKGFGGRNLKQEPTTVRVRKVGTKLVHILQDERVPDGPTSAYRIENGQPSSQYTEYELWRPEDWGAESRRSELEAALNQHGVEVWRKKQPIAVLEEILAVLHKAASES